MSQTIRSLKKVGNNFVYELLPIELTKISEEKIDDTKITLKDFSSSAKKELTVTNLIFLGDIDHINLSSSLADRAFTLFQTSCPAISSTST